MQAYDKYNLVLCIVVFVLLTVLFAILITVIVKLSLKTINAGLDDERIKTEYLKEQEKKKSLFCKILSSALPILVCAILACALILSLYSRFSQNSKVGNIPTMKVVESGSMEIKNKSNGYLYDNNLNDQISTFDIVVLHKLPKEEDLKLYDIVVYEVDGYFIIHRIVAIEEPNSKHPNERWFVLRGDSNVYADDFPVRYSQMKSIYRGQSIPQLGMLVIFMQSPAGMLCFLLVLLAVIVTPIIEKKLREAIKNRLIVLGVLTERGEVVALTGRTADSGLVVSTTTSSSTQEIDEEKVEQEVVQEESASKKKVVRKIPIVVDKPAEQDVEQENEEVLEIPFDRFSKFKERKAFKQKLRKLPKEKVKWYKEVSSALMSVSSVRKTEAKYHELYRKGRKSIAKIAIKGKSIYVYLAVDPKQYTATKYGIKDISSVKAHSSCPAECKITSNRKVKYLIEIIKQM